MDLDSSYDVYRALFPDRKIPLRECEFLKRMYTLDVSRLNGVATRFPAYEELLDLLKDECNTPGEEGINGDAARGRAKELLAKWLDIRNRNGKPYTEADDMARDMSLRIGMCRELGLLVISVGSRKECGICVLDGPLGGFMYFDDRAERLPSHYFKTRAPPQAALETLCAPK